MLLLKQAATRFWFWLGFGYVFIKEEKWKYALLQPRQPQLCREQAWRRISNFGLGLYGKHAYYLKLNQEIEDADYINAFFNVVDWDKVAAFL